MKIIGSVLGAVILISTLCSAQYKSNPLLWKVFVSAGYANVKSADIENYYSSIVDSYRSLGVPIPTQTPFGRTAIISSGCEITLIRGVWTGISISYLYSPAYSNYADYGGTLKIKGNVNTADISIIFETELQKFGIFPLILHIQPGLCYTHTFVIQQFRNFSSPQMNLDEQLTASAWGPSGQMMLGTSVPVGTFTMSFLGGYRLNFAHNDQQSISSSAGDSTIDEIWNIGISGIIMYLSFEKEL